jgi:acetylornithine deacetylase/succinyl-diaminopimelate desuccinylase-like protein
MKYDITHLISLYKLHTPTGDDLAQDKISTFIMSVCNGYNWTMDKERNIYGRHPLSESRICISSHLDMVKTGDPLTDVLYCDDTLIGLDANLKQTSLGADDKNGIFAAITCANIVSDKDKPLLAFFVAEETGMNGSRALSKEFFAGVDECIVIDRKGNTEIVVKGGCGNYTSVLGAKIKFISPVWSYGSGSACDANNVRKVCDCVNLACGYYNAHSRTEYTIVSQLFNTIDCVVDYLTKSTDKIPAHELKELHAYLYDTETKGGLYGSYDR